MELQFDKEIDAILRKARSGNDVGVKNSHHLDADIIAAFAENAVPQKARSHYVEHLADCERCRRQLSRTILFNSEADATAASSVLAVAAPVASVPWYQGFFKTPNLAFAMGALLLMFTGGIGYLLLQNRDVATNAIVTQVADDRPKQGGPFVASDDEAASGIATQPVANANASVNAPAANTIANTATTNTANKTARRGEAAGDNSSGGTGTSEPAETVTGAPPQPVSPPPPPPEAYTIDGSSGSDAAKPDADEGKAEKDLGLSKRKEMEDRSRSRRDAPPPASKSGPARAGPLQSQNNQANQIYEMSVTRVAGGKTFNNRDGAWYDSQYRGQATINVRRGSQDYNKLDSGLRRIADNIGGTVVVVWKGKPYRIS